MVKSLQQLNDDTALLRDNGDKTILNQLDTVDAILRDYAVLVMGTADEVAQGKITGNQLVAKLQAEGKRLEGIFYGRDKGYAVERWNSPEQLGKYIVNTVGIGGDPADAVERLLAGFANELVPEVSAYQQGKQTEDMLQVAAEELIERYRHYLMGMPLPFDYWD